MSRYAAWSLLVLIGAQWLIGCQFQPGRAASDEDSRSPVPLTLAPRPPTAVAPTEAYAVVGDVFGMGLEEISPAGGLGLLAEAGVHWVHSDSGVVNWSSVEPKEGMRNWASLAGLGQQLRNASAQGMHVILNIRSTPAWAQKLPGHACGPVRMEKLDAFASFVHDLVKRYSVAPYGVAFWEIWNEEDIASDLVSPESASGCWGDPTDPYYGGGYYATMLKVVYPQIKAADPQAKVLVGGLFLGCDPRAGGGCSDGPPEDAERYGRPSRFLEGILRNNGGPFFDGVSFHAYDYYSPISPGKYANLGWNSRWDTLGPVLVAKSDFVRQMLEQYGVVDKLLINTEAGLLCDVCDKDETFERTKAAYLVQTYAASISEGLEGTLWYSLQGWRNSGLLGPDLSPRPAYVAYRFAHNELSDVTYLRALGAFPGLKGYEFNRPDGRVWVLWSVDGETHPVPLAESPQAVFNLFGMPLPSEDTMSVGGMPLYISWSP